MYRSGFALTNGLYYISYHNGMFTQTTRASLANLWASDQQAAAVAKRRLPNALKKQAYRPVYLRIEDMQNRIEEHPQPTKAIRAPSSRLGNSGFEDADAAYNTLRRQTGVCETVASLRDTCESEISREEMIQGDILHRIEFDPDNQDVNAALYKKLRQCRLRRRAFKDVLYLIQKAGMAKTPEDWNASLDAAQQELNDRLYLPRSKEVFHHEP